MPVAVNYGTGISSAWSNVATFVPKFLVFLIILVVGWLIARLITKAISAVLTRIGFDRVVERGGIKKALVPATAAAATARPATSPHPLAASWPPATWPGAGRPPG